MKGSSLTIASLLLLSLYTTIVLASSVNIDATAKITSEATIGMPGYSNIWSPVPTLLWSNERSAKLHSAPHYENSVLPMDAVVDRFNKELFDVKQNDLVVGFLYDRLSTQEFSRFVGAYPTTGSDKIGERIMKESASVVVLPYTERPSSAESSTGIPLHDLLQANAEGRGWYTKSIESTNLVTKQELIALRAKHKKVYLSIRMSSKLDTSKVKSVLRIMLNTLKDFDGYSAFITGEKSEVIPLSVGKSILMDEVPNVDSLFVEEASTRTRRSLADGLVEKPTAAKVTAYVPSSPETMSATLIMLFLFYVLWAAIGCMTAIPSAQKMFQQPPGPKDGDPQYTNTVNEGKRYYPYKNLPFKEY